MKCPMCRAEQTKVISHPYYPKGEDFLRRRRVCLSCGYRFRTKEFYVPDEEVEEIRRENVRKAKEANRRGNIRGSR